MSDNGLLYHPLFPPSFAAEEERTWTDTAEEEAEIKLELAEMLWDDLLTEVAEELVAMDRKVQRRRSSGAVGLVPLPRSRGSSHT